MFLRFLSRVRAVPLRSLIAAAGTAYLVAVAVLVITRTPLGSPLFFTMAALMCAAYLAVVVRVWHSPVGSRRTLLLALALAVLFRIPLAVSPVGPDSDMVRYLWDGRVQLLGYNPYIVVPADPAMAPTHTAETAAMPSRRHRTPYPPAAQLFFRLVVALRDSTLTMKLAIVFCDLMTIAVLWRWLAVTNRNVWLALVYAWHPLVVLEVSHSGHIDAVATMWVAAAAYWLTVRRSTLASVAFVLAVATKLLPVVLAPLFIGRVRFRDAAAGAGLLAALYLLFADRSSLPLGAVPNIVANIRFNSPVFSVLAATTNAQLAAASAVLLGFTFAAWARRRLDATDPAAWAWPMTIALFCAPVVYPWYLLCVTPFLFTTPTLPVMAWTFSVIPVYTVWHLARTGGRWTVPGWIMAVEFAALAIATLGLLGNQTARLRSSPTPPPEPD
jgi:hypothetical protein